MSTIPELQRRELSRERTRIINQIEEVKRKEMEKPSVLNIWDARRPRLERDLGRGGLLRRQRDTFLLQEKRKTLLKRKQILDILLKK